jgi:hypothetical protein
MDEILMTLSNLLEDGLINQEQFDKALEDEEFAEEPIYTMLYGDI